jgi:diacylglycerol kinase family enzyme
VLNPHAGGGRAGRAWPQIREELESLFPAMEVARTTAPAQAALLVRDALRQGCLEIVAVGGDGTANEALNGFFDAGRPVAPDAVFSVVPAGKHDDLARGLGMTPGAQGAVAFLKRARIRKTDIGLLSCLDEAGEPAYRYFLNHASFGASAELAAARNRGGLARLASLWRWQAPRVRLMTDTGLDEIAGITAVVVANGRQYGGGLAVAPAAQTHDGRFDVAVVAGVPRARARAALRGGGRTLFAARLTAVPVLETHGRVAVECDGEWAGHLPATFEVLPGAINLRC